MPVGAGNFSITIRRRSWWNWFLAAFWACAEVLLVQTAWASGKGEEYRASSICWIAAAVLAMAGVFAWVRALRRL